MKPKPKTRVRRRLLVVIVGTVVLGVLGGAAYAYRWQRIRKHYAALRADGMAAVPGGDHKKVVDLLGPYLQRFPSDVDALAAYAKSRPVIEDPDGRHVLETIQVLRHLLKLSPGRDQELRALLDLYGQTGFLTETLETADAVLAKDAKDVRAQGLKARSLLRLRRLPEALAAVDRWADLAPDSYEPDLVAIETMRQLGQRGDEIVARTKARLDAHPNDPRFELVHAIAHAVAGNRDAALGLLRRVSHAYRYDLLADRLATAGIGSPVALLRLGGASAPAFRAAAEPAVGVLLIDQLDRLAAADESLAVLEVIGRRPAADVRARAALGTRYWEAGRWAEAADVLGAATAAAGTDGGAELLALRAVALVYANRPDEAAAAQAVVAGRSGDPVAKAWAMLLEQVVRRTAPIQGKPLMDACQAALAKTPNSPYLYHFVGEGYAQLGETDAAIRSWRQSAERTATWATPLVRMADMLATTGRYDAALGVASQAFRRGVRTGADRAGLYRVLSACVEGGRIGVEPGLLKEVERVQAEMPGEESTLAVQVGMLGRSDRPMDRARAAAIIRAAIKSDTRFTAPGLFRLASISQASRLGVEEDCFARFEKDFGLTPGLAYARAVAWFAVGKPNDGLRLLEQARGTATADKPGWDSAWAKYLDLVQDPRAAAAIVALGDANPGDLEVQQIAMRSRATRQDKDFITRTVDRVRALTGEQAIGWQLARARWLLEFGGKTGPAEAAKLLADAVRASPESLEARLLLARALESNNDSAGAVEHLSAAANIDPDSSAAVLNLIRLLQFRGDNERANEMLARVAKSRLADPEQRRQAAVLLARQGQSRQASELLKRDPADGTQYELLQASLHRALNQPAEVHQILARRLQKPDVETIAFAADFYAAAGNRPEAARCLALLDTMKLDAGLKQLTLADHATVHGAADEAAKLYTDAGRLAEKSELKGRAWRSLVGGLLVAGKAEDALAATSAGLQAVPTDEALAAVKDLAPVLGPALQDPRLRPFAAAVVRDPVNRAAASQLLKEVTAAVAAKLPPEQLAARIGDVADRHPQFTQLQALLAYEYLQLRQPEQAAAVAAKASQAAPGSAGAARLSAEVLLAGQRWSEALQAAQRWRDMEPAAPLQADVAIARAYAGLGQQAAVLRQLAPHVRPAGNAPADGHKVDAQVLSLYARALEGTGKIDEAAGMLEPLLKRDAQWRRGWAVFAVESLSEDRAIAWLDWLNKLVPADPAPDEQVVVAESFARLAAKYKNAAYADRAREILKAISARPDATPLAVLAMGMRLEQDKALDEAEKLYRQVVATTAADAEQARLIARNNLAMLLARRGTGMAEAVGFAKAAAAAQPGQAELQDTLAFVLAKAGEFEAAAAAAAAATRLAPDEPRHYVQHARILVAGGQFQQAGKVLAKVEERFSGLTRLPDDLRAEVGTLRGEILKADGQPPRASNGQ